MKILPWQLVDLKSFVLCFISVNIYFISSSSFLFFVLVNDNNPAT